MMVTDEKLMYLTQAFKGLPLVEPERERSPKHFGIASKGPANSQGVYMNVHECVRDERGVVASLSL